MADSEIVLLPGLDGTAQLFKRFVAAAPPHLSCTPIALPAEPLTYEELADEIAKDVHDGPIVVIAESFSGPLAVALVERVRVAALVFCNSFVVAPRARVFRWVARPVVFRPSPPRFLLRRYLLGDRADEALVCDVAKAVRSVPPNVLASRLQAVLSVDAAVAFRSCAVPMLYIRGTEDRLVPESAWQRMTALRPMHTARVSGPHLLLQANPVEAWQAIHEFLATLPAV